jgi:hypothetical protein
MNEQKRQRKKKGRKQDIEGGNYAETRKEIRKKE